MNLLTLVDYLDIARHYIGHYGGLAFLWYWSLPADMQIRLYAGLLGLGALVGVALARRLVRGRA